MSDLFDRQSLIDAFESLDLIGRQAATKSLVRPRVIDPYDQYWTGRNDQYDADVSALQDMPSAEPERKKGFWIIENEFLGDCIDRCSACGWKYSYYGFDDERDDYNFCPNCGADMRGGEDDNIVR